jgi:hypothetical protein
MRCVHVNCHRGREMRVLRFKGDTVCTVSLHVSLHVSCGQYSGRAVIYVTHRVTVASRNRCSCCLRAGHNIRHEHLQDAPQRHCGRQWRGHVRVLCAAVKGVCAGNDACEATVSRPPCLRARPLLGARALSAYRCAYNSLLLDVVPVVTAGHVRGSVSVAGPRAA